MMASNEDDDSKKEETLFDGNKNAPRRIFSDKDKNVYNPEWLKGTSAEKEDYSHPAYRSLSRINGKINTMSMKELMKSLNDLNLDTGGQKEVLIKRLKFHHRKATLTNANIQVNFNKNCDFDFVAVIDYEATCVERQDQTYQHEIIEFPVVLVNMRTLQIDKVADADEFPNVLSKVENFFESHKLGTDFKFAIATDGPWDMQKFLNLQCSYNNIPYPFWAKKWIDIRKLFSNWFGVRRCGILKMLNYFNLEFEGQQHCGLDDAKNISRILIKLAEDGCKIILNDSIDKPLMQFEKKSESFLSTLNNSSANQTS